jgi:tetratricopeptide (TPR) repeat protein
MEKESTLEELRTRAQETLRRLNGLHGDEAINAALPLLTCLRNSREHEALAAVAEAIGRLDPNQATARRHYAQALIETGKVTAALDVLQALSRRVSKGDPEALEAAGLIGRAYKQIFFDSGDRGSAAARDALKQAIAAYRKPYEANRANTWRGVNLLALIANARRLGVRLGKSLDPRALARELLNTLQQVPSSERDVWHLPTVAEVTLGLDDWDEVERVLHEYVGAPGVHAFQLQSTLRQFTKIWNLEDDPRGRDLVNILRARLLQLPGGCLELSRQELQRVRDMPTPSAPQLEAILGNEGAKTYNWWKTGLERASSVGAIRQKLGGRVGTGFVVRAADVGRAPGDELLVLTNFHVVNPSGATPGIQPSAAEVVFEAVDSSRIYGVAEILWSSPPDQCDAALLRLDASINGVVPLPLTRNLPLRDPPARVYVIGHPGGRELAFSLQDNELLDHEGPPAGKPAIPNVWRVHYRAPTEGGSSGSPVFNASSWEVIALHHKGGKTGMPKLNGVQGSYAANEGIAMESLLTAMKS